MTAAASPPPPDLTSARARVMAIAHGSAMSTRPPAADATAPLRAVAPVTEARIAARAEAGLAPLGPDYPRRGVWQRVVAPSGALALVDLLGAVVALAQGEVLLGVFALVLFVPFAGLALFGARFAAADPLRLRAGERRALAAAAHWQSPRDWTGPLAGSIERGVVLAAANAAERIAASPAWRTGRVDELRVQLDLDHELDQIDEQAHRVAGVRAEHGPVPAGSAPAVDTAWDATVERVAALTAYADQLDGYERRWAAAQSRQGDAVRDSGLLAGAEADRMSAEQLTALVVYLNASWGGAT